MRFSCFLIALLGIGGLHGFLSVDDLREELEQRDFNKAILEMLHINKLSKPQQAKPHPYMKQVYESLDTQVRELSAADGTLVQSFRSIEDSKHGVPGWIWFNVSHLSPSMKVAELVLLRKTLHPMPLSVTVTVHGISPETGNLSISGPLVERLLSLNHLHPSGYDVFDVTAAITQRLPRSDALGFQLRFRDESGSLVLHEALTQSFYCLNGSSLSQPLLVVYRAKSMELRVDAEPRQRHDCTGSSEHNKERMRLRNLRRAAHSPCKLHVHRIDLNSSQLSRWILQPSHFNISICSGICSKEMSTPSVTFHRHSKNDLLQRSNCIPQGLSSLLVMYSIGNSDIIIKEIKDIRADRCVCLPTSP